MTVSSAPLSESAPNPSGSTPRLGITDAELQRIRSDFPILSRTVRGGAPLVYLDSAATSQKPASVLNAENAFYTSHNAAVHRGAHALAEEATEAFEAARARIAQFVGTRTDEIIWTKNATEAINLVAYAMSNATLGRGGPASGRFALFPGDEILVTEMEHHANLVPWQELAARTGASLTWLPLSEDGYLARADTLITERTAVLAVTHASNVLGTINPVAELAARAHAVGRRGRGAIVVVDACQSVPNMPVDLPALDADFAAFSGHKMLGPTGIGVLYGRAELLADLPPFLTGGSMVEVVTMAETTYATPPLRFEAGTQMVAQAVALTAAADYLTEVGMASVAAHEAELGVRLIAGVQSIPGVRLLGPAEPKDRLALASVDVEGVHAHDVGQFLDDVGIATRVGHHCAQPTHRRYGVTASTRASVGLYTTAGEIDAFLEALARVRSFFGVGSRR